MRSYGRCRVDASKNNATVKLIYHRQPYSLVVAALFSIGITLGLGIHLEEYSPDYSLRKQPMLAVVSYAEQGVTVARRQLDITARIPCNENKFDKKSFTVRHSRLVLRGKPGNPDTRNIVTVDQGHISHKPYYQTMLVLVYNE